MSIIIAIIVLAFVIAGTALLRGAVAQRRRDAMDAAHDANSRSQPAQRRCAECGHMNTPDGEFCGRCGRTLD